MRITRGNSGITQDTLAAVTYEGEANTYPDLPTTGLTIGDVWNVKTATGVPFVNRKKAGLYTWEGTDWEYQGEATANEVAYSNTTSGLVAVTAGAAIDEIVATNLSQQTDINNKADINHTHVKADITDFNEADYATAAQGALADTATQPADIPALVAANETVTNLAVVGTDLVYTKEDGTTDSIPLDTFGEDDTNLSRIVSGSIGDFFTLTLVRDDSTQFDVDLSSLVSDTTNSTMALDGSNNLVLTDSANNTVSADLSSLDDSAAIAALAAGAVAMNAAALLTKAGVNHTHVEADITDLDKYTQSEADALLANKSDVGHTHVEADITDLDKYTQAEADTLLDEKVSFTLANVDFFVAPDAASAQAGDFIGGTGIRDAIREASKYMIQNPTSFIRIYLRDGEYTLIAPIEIAHAQGKKVIQLRPLTVLNSTNFQTIDSALVMNDQAADDATLAANYSVIINCPSYAMFFDKGSGVESVDSIMFRYTGTVTTRAAVYCAQQGSATVARCAFIGFPYGVRALEFASVGLTVGSFILYCNLTAIRAEEGSVVRITQSTNYRNVFHSITQYTLYALTMAYIRCIGTSTGIVRVINDSTTRSNFLVASNSTMAITRADMIGGDEGVRVVQGSTVTMNTCTATGNNAHFMTVDGLSYGSVASCTGDVAGSATQQTVLATGMSYVIASGANTNLIFDPLEGSVPDSSRIT